jgi:hypothetical protein
MGLDEVDLGRCAHGLIGGWSFREADERLTQPGRYPVDVVDGRGSDAEHTVQDDAQEGVA